ncbi:hypothetical protein C5Z25_02550 [Lactobacillus sp. CBA3605]|uniref:hypothetical protein n=1 Tax=Lactobacillus sp. CBA3605 TaxID=2099788 RepID=UPI000CFCE2CF|nr:hypothetical protein [Lactobacillus sp. CBA3605]AVK60694.1 hypothetical protein C5Z25_02550 [Lactobacillus sp. CBA3605]
MKKRRGMMLLSVMSFLLIFGAFESHRYISYVQRQTIYRYMLKAYREPLLLQPSPITKTSNSVATN